MLTALVLVGVKPVHAAEIPPGVEVYFPNEALDCGVWPDRFYTLARLGERIINES